MEGHTHLEGQLSPSSSTEELAQINKSSEEGVAGAGGEEPNGTTSAHQIVKPEATKSITTQPVGVAGNYPPPTAGTYAGNQAPPLGYHPGLSSEPSHQGGGYPSHAVSLSQPVPAPVMSHGMNPLPGQMSLSQGGPGPAYYHHIPSSRGEGSGAPPVPPYGPGYTRQKMAYENVPMVYETLQSNSRHSHLPHPHGTQGPHPHPAPPPVPPQAKYGGGAQQGQHQQPGYNARERSRDGHMIKSHSMDARERSHDAHMIKSHSLDYPAPMMRPSGYNVNPVLRRKPIKPASVSVAHDAAASGDIATLVSFVGWGLGQWGHSITCKLCPLFNSLSLHSNPYSNPLSASHALQSGDRCLHVQRAQIHPRTQGSAAGAARCVDLPGG